MLWAWAFEKVLSLKEIYNPQMSVGRFAFHRIVGLRNMGF